MPSKNKEQWREETLGPSVKRFPERQEEFVTDSGLKIDDLYAAEDLTAQGIDAQRDLGYPGEYPYTRGVQPNTYRGRIWTMRQYSGYSTAADTNRRFRYLLEQGQTGLSVAFDLPTQIGYDSDHPRALGETGNVGVPICSLEDMEVLLDGIPLDRVSTSMTINATASILLCLYIAAAKKQGVTQDKISGTLQNDILKEYIARGTYAYPPRPSMRLVVDVFKYCADNVPRWNTISVSGYHMREAGATAIQELAFTFANAIAYVQAAIDAGLEVDDFAPRVSFFFVAQNNLFEEVAKYRAARRMWAKIMKEQFGAKDPRSMMLRFHTQTAGVSLTAQQPDNNLIRCTVQALAAILGGSQSLHVNSRDEALALPTEESVQLSLRTQQILAYESGAADVVDPLGGSYYVESLTNQLEAAAYDYIDRIEQLGGTVSAIEQGFQMREIGDSAYQHRREVESGSRIIVGVNRFVTDSPPIEHLTRVDPEAAQHQIQRLKRLRKERDDVQVKAALARLSDVAKDTVNTVPAILECVESYCTLGEICQVFRDVFGEQEELAVF
ncbi:MAG: methylmalonyl-CoA mutase family protein [Chloroflexi bacterium]|nr:methylmalonyl-CoA mutase family protein [Chloroflexota bacterium]MCI0785672.1 methylmalonyl-CoA mutase family protein [Chloroflexota bacterium]MCI0866136.1 methylmalonyl-CoA mutase family protein [Chloroflexota bacterium]MCI0894412.1 methylmalonyl-CoA mutase family protein [Chloroflexota bacterium]